MNSLIIQTCYVDAKLKSDKSDERNFSACCKYCFGKKFVSGNVNSSSNCIDHIKVGPIKTPSLLIFNYCSFSTAYLCDH